MYSKNIMDKIRKRKCLPAELDMSDSDIYEAMKDIHGYVDVTPADLKEIFKFAYRHALDRLTQHMKARDVMTAKVVSVVRMVPVKEVVELMAEKGVSGIPVVEPDGRIAGIISEKDFLSRMNIKGNINFMTIIAESLFEKCGIHTTILNQKAEDIMTSPAITVRANVTVSEISTIFTEKNINRVPVTDDEERLIGIVSRTDIVRVNVQRKTG